MESLTDPMVMRFRLQRVASYRHLCRAIRRSGRQNVIFALLMLYLAYITFPPAAVGVAGLLAIGYIALSLAELSAGLFKSIYPSAEGVLLDGVILVLFAAWSLGRLVLGLQPTANWIVFLGLYMLWGAVGRFREYGHLRRLFADRPTADQIAWFDELVYEIRQADPEVDDQALDLPTKPGLRAKLLGHTAFVAAVRGDLVVVAGPEEFSLSPVRKGRRGEGRRVELFLNDQAYPEFEIDDASWANYLKWVASNANTIPGPTLEHGGSRA